MSESPTLAASDAGRGVAALTAGWKPIADFDPGIHPLVSKRFLIAGTHQNGVPWSDACHWDYRGWFAGHRLDDVEFWQFMPEHPVLCGDASDVKARAMTELDTIAALLKLRAQIARLSHEIDSISELRTVDMRRNLRLAAERMREMVSTHEMTEACKR